MSSRSAHVCPERRRKERRKGSNKLLSPKSVGVSIQSRLQKMERWVHGKPYRSGYYQVTRGDRSADRKEDKTENRSFSSVNKTWQSFASRPLSTIGAKMRGSIEYYQHRGEVMPCCTYTVGSTCYIQNVRFKGGLQGQFRCDFKVVSHTLYTKQKNYYL